MKNDRSSANPVANSMVTLREEFDDWAILFDPETGKALGINPLGVFIWKLLDGERSEHDILEAVTQGYSEAPPDAADHIREYLDALRARGFVGYEIDQKPSGLDGPANPESEAY